MSTSGKHFTPINYIEFAANDLSKIKAFYSAAFDWVFTDYGPDYTAFEKSGICGGFYKHDKFADADHGSALVVLYSTEIEACQKRVQKLGASIKTEIFDFPGGRRFHFLDPCNNELAVWTDK